jgi:hypothetical protein
VVNSIKQSPVLRGHLVLKVDLPFSPKGDLLKIYMYMYVHV